MVLLEKDTSMARHEYEGKTLHRADGLYNLQQTEKQLSQNDKWVPSQPGGSPNKADYTVGMVQSPHMKHFASSDNILNEGKTGRPPEAHSREMRRSRSSELLLDGKPIQQQGRQRPVEIRQKRPVPVDQRYLAPVRDSQFSALGDDDVFTPGPIRHSQMNATHGTQRSIPHNRVDTFQGMSGRPTAQEKIDAGRPAVRGKVDGITGRPAQVWPSG